MSVTINGTNGITLPAGSASAPYLTGTDTATGIYQPAANTLGFSTGGSERMRIDSSGNLLVGTTSPIGGNNSFGHFANIDGGKGGITVGNTTGALATTCIQFRNSNGAVGSISTSGTSTAYNTSSDYRLKENVQPMTAALAKIAALKPVTYTWKADGSAGEGFIAHELQAVVPDAVTGEKDAVDKDGKPIYQGIDTSFLVATLTAAIQEQQAIITAQSTIITDMQAKLKAAGVAGF